MTARSYDTGLSTAQRSAVRQAVVTALTPLLLASLGGSTRGYVRKIGLVPRILKSDHEDDMAWLGNAVQGQAPCILIALGRKEYEPTGLDIPAIHYVAKLELALYAVSGNVRSYVDGRLSTDVAGVASLAADPGVETLLENIEELLLGQVLPNLSTTHELRPQSEDEIYTGGDFTIWEQRYSVLVDREINPDRLITQLLLTIENNTVLDDGVDPQTQVVETITTTEVP